MKHLYLIILCFPWGKKWNFRALMTWFDERMMWNFLLKFGDTNIKSSSSKHFRAAVPNFLAPGTSFMEDNSSTDWRQGWFQDDSSTLYLLCTSFLLLLCQLHLRSSGIRSWRLGTVALEYWFKENTHFSYENKDMQRKDHKLAGNLGFGSGFTSTRASLVAQMVKNLSSMWETHVRSLSLEDPLEKGMTTLAWRIP